MQPDSFQNENEAIFLYQNEVNLCDRETKWPPPRFVLQAFAQAAQHKIRLAIDYHFHHKQQSKYKNKEVQWGRTRRNTRATLAIYS